MLGITPTETAFSAAVYTSARSIPHAGNIEACGCTVTGVGGQVPPKLVLVLEQGPGSIEVEMKHASRR